MERNAAIALIASAIIAVALRLLATVVTENEAIGKAGLDNTFVQFNR
jgi:hypothetical protein